MLADRTFRTDDSVVGWWRFDDNPATLDAPDAACSTAAGSETVCDYSTHNNHGTPSGSPTWLPPPQANILGGAISFDGVNDSIQVQNDSTLGVGAGLTVSCKINPVHTPTFTAVILKEGASPGPYGIAQDTTDAMNFAVYTSGSYKSAASDISGLLGTNFRVTGI
jgi:hypothetical protein